MGKRMPGRLSFVKIFSACGSIIYRRKRRKTDELDIGWGCGGGHSGLRRCGNESWNYTAITDLNDLIPMEKLNRVMAVGKNEISVYAMTKGKKQTNATKTADTENASVSARNETTQNEKTQNEATQKQ